MKKIFIIIISLFIAFIPLFTLGNISFAEDNTEWAPCETQEERVAAFKAYIAARNKKINVTTDSGGLTGLTVNVIYNLLDTAAHVAGLDLDDVFANAYYQTKNGKLGFLYEGSIAEEFDVMMLGMIDEYQVPLNEEKIIYSGKYISDDLGNSCQIFIIDSSVPIDASILGQNKSYITYYGTPLKYDSITLNSLVPNVNDTYTPFDEFNGVRFSDKTITHKNYLSSTAPHYTVDYLTTGDSYWAFQTSPLYQTPLNNAYGFYTVGKIGNNYYWGLIYFNWWWYFSGDVFTFLYNPNQKVNEALFDNSDTSIYNGDSDDDTDTPIIWYPKPTIPDLIDDDDPEVEVPEKDPEQKPVPPDSVKPNPDNPTIDPGNPDFNFTMPDINIDWQLDLDPDNLPFPFSIPNDIYNAFDTLNVEAEAPHFEGTVDLYVCEWDIDIDFEQFSSLANIFNKWFLFVYVVGLIIATRSLMHIY